MLGNLSGNAAQAVEKQAGLGSGEPALYGSGPVFVKVTGLETNAELVLTFQGEVQLFEVLSLERHVDDRPRELEGGKPFFSEDYRSDEPVATIAVALPGSTKVPERDGAAHALFQQDDTFLFENRQHGFGNLSQSEDLVEPRRNHAGLLP